MAKKIDRSPTPALPTTDPSSWPGLVFRIISNVKILLIILLVLAFIYIGLRLANIDVLPPILAKLGVESTSVDKGTQVTFTDRAELVSRLNKAKREIKAVGCVLEKLEPGDLIQWLQDKESLHVELVMSDPRGDLVERRVIDEIRDDNREVDPNLNRIKIQTRIGSFLNNGRRFFGDKLKVGVIDTYPTIEVFIIDEDLYAYPFPYGNYGSSMPIMKFINYEKNEYAKPYKAHLDSILKEVRRQDTYIEKINWNLNAPNTKPAPNNSFNRSAR